jgi:hypothetical protein
MGEDCTESQGPQHIVASEEEEDQEEGGGEEECMIHVVVKTLNI